MEEELKRHDFNYTIIKITKVVSVNIKLFENWIKKIKLNHSIRVYGNYYFSPISTKYLVNNILKIKRKGIFHLSNQKSLSYYQFLKLLINKIDKRKKILIKKIYSDVHNSKTLKLKMPNKLKNYGIKPQNIKSTIKDLLNQI